MRVLPRWLYKLIPIIFGITFFYALFCYSNRPYVSVVLPVYNGSKNGYLHRSIKSVLNQSYPDFELILIDDGSTDNSWEILTDYAQKDKRIRIFRNEKNQGISYTRNKGNDLARGKYIMIMDQDDDNHPDRILKQLAFFELKPWIDVLATPAGEKAPWVPLYNQDSLRFLLFFNNNFGHPNIMVRRSFLKDHNIRYNEKYTCANDYDWLVQILKQDGKFAYMYEQLFYYNGANLSAGSKCFIESREIIKELTGSKIDMFSDKSKYACDILENALATKYAHLFTPGFLAIKEQQFCKDTAE